MTATATTTEPTIDQAPPPEPPPELETSGLHAGVTSGIAALAPFARPARGQFVLAGLLAAAATLLALVPFWAIYRTVDELVAGRPARDELWLLAGLALVAIVARFTLFTASIWVSHLAAYRVLYEVRVTMAEHLTRVPLGYVTGRRSGELKKVMGDDVERLELFLAHGIPDMVAAVVTLAGAGVWLVAVDWRMGLATFVLLIPAVVCLRASLGGAGAHMGEYQRTLAVMTASVVELIRGMPVVKVFNRGSDEVRGAQRSIHEHVEVTKAYSRSFLPLGTAFSVLLTANVAVIVPVGVWLHDRGSLSSTDLLFFLIVGLGALVPVAALLSLFANFSYLSSGGTLVRQVLDAAVLDDRNADQQPVDASVELRHVSFGYGRRRVLDDVSFRAEPGTITALVGASGAGKSTIASLVARFWDADEGAVLVGGADVRRIPVDRLSRHVSVVFQDTFLFDETVATNLRIARPEATDEEMYAAARSARAHDFVVALPQGYDTVVGERGSWLSGGERQRLTLARAILADAPVIVLDEATAFTDPENEAAIQDAIGALVAGKTVLMIAHRLSTVAGADQILVVDDGRIVERGRHDDLVTGDGVYARQWQDFVAAESIALGGGARASARKAEVRP